MEPIKFWAHQIIFTSPSAYFRWISTTCFLSIYNSKVCIQYLSCTLACFNIYFFFKAKLFNFYWFISFEIYVTCTIFWSYKIIIFTVKEFMNVTFFNFYALKSNWSVYGRDTLQWLIVFTIVINIKAFNNSFDNFSFFDLHRLDFDRLLML
jgi:hypothetical protein